MSNSSFSPVNNSKFDNQTNDQDNFLNGAYDNLDPELERFECMQKINVEYSIHVPANSGIQTTSTQFGQKTISIQPCIHFCNKGACYKAELPLNAIGWNQFKFLLYESTNSSEVRFHEVIRTFDDTFEKWKLSVAKHPKAEIGVKILNPNPKERLENQKKIDLVRSMELITSNSLSGWSLSQSSLMVGNTTKARIKALMAQLVKEYPISNKYSKEALVYINTANPKGYIHITYEMCKKWARMILEEVPTVTISRPPLFEADFQPWLILGSKKTNIEKDNNVEWPGMPFGLGNGSTQQQPRIPSPELPPQEGGYSFDRFLEFGGLNHLKSFERNHLHNNGLDNIKVLLSKHTTYD
ncbi:hypothetical protein BY996DRAFT_6411926 [Phakopsora pachyrhizi]|nr:hypothetical protein BY996DRAFT_6411926 [Phakopsora pachyrhizi]